MSILGEEEGQRMITELPYGIEVMASTFLLVIGEVGAIEGVSKGSHRQCLIMCLCQAHILITYGVPYIETITLIRRSIYMIAQEGGCLLRM